MSSTTQMPDHWALEFLQLNDMALGFRDRLEKAEAENAKLRELVRDMWGWELHGCGACSEAAGCDTDLYSPYCLMREMLPDRMRELGVDA